MSTYMGVTNFEKQSSFVAHPVFVAFAVRQARFVSRTPAKFIWAGKSINDVVLKSDVIVNHFPKAKYFSSKVITRNVPTP